MALQQNVNSKARRWAVADLDYVGIFAFGPKVNELNKNNWPVRFAISNEPERFLRTGQSYHWSDLDTFAFYWTTGRPLAERVLKQIGAFFEEKEWEIMRSRFAGIPMNPATAHLVCDFEIREAAARAGVELISMEQYEFKILTAIQRAERLALL